MAHVQGEIVIHRPVDEVFGFVADERNEPKYNSDMVRSEKVTNGPIGVGSRFHAEMKSIGGRKAEMLIVFTGYERPRLLRSATRLASMDIDGTLTFDTVDGSTLMKWSWDVKPRGLYRLMAPLIGRMGRRQEERIWTCLKRHLEAQSSPPNTV